MSVTQDYNLVTLTRSELAVVRIAMIDRETFLREMLDTDPCPAHRDMYRALLSPVQSTLAKVRA